MNCRKNGNTNQSVRKKKSPDHISGIAAGILVAFLLLAVPPAVGQVRTSPEGGAGDDTLTFRIDEGRSANYFFQNENTSAHIILTGGDRSSVYVCFPAENSGLAIRFDGTEKIPKKVKLDFDGEPGGFYPEDDLRGVWFNVRTNTSKLVIDDLQLDSIRFIRSLDWKSGPEKEVENRKQFLGINEIPKQGNLVPAYEIVPWKKNGGYVLFARRNDLDGKNRYHAQIAVPPGAEIRIEGQKIILESEKDPLRFTVSAAVSYPSLVPYKTEELLNAKALEYYNTLKKSGSPKARQFEQALNGLRFLSYKEKFLAGSWRYLTYFGRDTMMSAMLLKESITTEAYENAVSSVLDRMNPSGGVAHEEDIGSFAIDRHLPAYLALITAGDKAGAEKVRKNFARPVFDYKMVDDDFMYPLMLQVYIDDEAVPKERKRAFLEKKNASGKLNVETTAENFEWILKKTRVYADNPLPKNLIKLHEEHYDGDWRDSEAGLGFGRYPGSVNVALVPASLTAVSELLQSGIYSPNELKKIARSKGLAELESVLEAPETLEKMIATWKKAKEHFLVRLTPEETRKRLRAYLETGPVTEQERKYYLSKLIDTGTTLEDFLYGEKTPPVLRNGITLYALSLDKKETPVEVLNSDAGFILFHSNPDPARLKEILPLIELPVPLGLSEQGGLLTANPALASDPSLWKALDKTGYHGMVVWSWHQALMMKGLERQIRRFRETGEHPELVERMYGALVKLRNMESAAGPLANSELWTHTCDKGTMIPVPYGLEAADETESNPVQLWSTVRISTMQGFEAIRKLLEK